MNASPGADAQVFDIHALLLVEAIAMFDTAAQPPIFLA
jgi:hypothetical protein